MDREKLTEQLAEAIRDGASEDLDPHYIAGKILSRLDQIGLVVVPREATPRMIEAGEGVDNWTMQRGTEFAPCEAHYLAMINAALSDTRIEDAGLPKIPVLRIEGLDE